MQVKKPTTILINYSLSQGRRTNDEEKYFDFSFFKKKTVLLTQKFKLLPFEFNKNGFELTNVTFFKNIKSKKKIFLWSNSTITICQMKTISAPNFKLPKQNLNKKNWFWFF